MEPETGERAPEAEALSARSIYVVERGFTAIQALSGVS